MVKIILIESLFITIIILEIMYSWQELENLHKLEIVHLENFLDGQVQAGKAMPLKDGYRRKREQLLSTSF